MSNLSSRILRRFVGTIHNTIARRRLIEFYTQFIGAGDLCFDVGANVGDRTGVFLALGARVVAIEPQPACISVLEKKYQSNPNVAIVSKGLAAQPGTLSLSICDSANTIATFSEKWKMGRFQAYEWASRVNVPVTTMDALIQEFGIPDFSKIDVEGFEYQVLQGLSIPIPILSFEFTKEFIEEAELCLDHLVHLGETEFNFAYGAIPELVLPQWTDAATLLGELCKIDDSLLWGDVYARLKTNIRE